MIYYCKRCGDTYRREEEQEKKCLICEIELSPVPKKYLYDACDDAFKTKELEQEFIEEVVKTSPVFEQERMDRRLEAQANNARVDAQIRARQKWGIHCPYCNGTIIERTSGMNRSVWFADAAAIGKQFRCLECKAYF